MSKQRIILELCKQLRLGTYMAEAYKTIEAETNEDFLISLLRVVVEERDIERKNRYLKQAGFDVIKSFANYSFDYVQLPEELSVDDLKECTFIENKQNLILFGKPGTGKTHLATAIGVEACRKGNRVAYYKTSRLVNDLVEAMASKNLESIWKKLLNAKLVILDEWGYIPFEKTGTQLLFEVISECYEQRSCLLHNIIPRNCKAKFPTFATQNSP